MESGSLSPLNLKLLPRHSLWHASRGVIYLYIPSPSSRSLILLQSTYILSRFMNRALCEIDNDAFRIDWFFFVRLFIFVWGLFL